ncbi:MAG: glutamate--tRNA ligase, partial [Synergistaceae bacterium]|nr:glutamate--tRNA ligase [Synergistaceae bacterium]
IYRALGWEVPEFAHLPMILGRDKKKLSKRHGATSIYEYRDMGYMPDSMFNFLALLGWSAGDDKEIFTRDEAAELFELSRVTRKAAVFDFDKLNYINQEHLKALPPEVRLSMVRPFWIEAGLPVEEVEASRGVKYLEDALTLMAGRGRTAKEMAEFSDYFVSFEPVRSRWNAEGIDKEKLRPFFEAIFANEAWKAEELEGVARSWIGEHEGAKMKDYAMPLRFALTGMKVSPGIFEVAELMGREECRKRLEFYGLL